MCRGSILRVEEVVGLRAGLLGSIWASQQSLWQLRSHAEHVSCVGYRNGWCRLVAIDDSGRLRPRFRWRTQTDEQRKYAILVAATILATRKLNEIGCKPCLSATLGRKPSSQFIQYPANRAQTVQSEPNGVFRFQQIADDSDKKIVVCKLELRVIVTLI